MIGCPNAVMSLLFGAHFAVSGGALRILGIGGLIQICLGLNAVTIDAYGQPGVVLRRQIISLIGSVAACLVLIPPLHIDGAAGATAFSMALANGLASLWLWRRKRILPWDRDLLITIAPLLLICAAALVFARDRGVLIILAVGLATAGLTLAAAWGTSDPAERAAVAQLLRRRRRGSRAAAQAPIA